MGGDGIDKLIRPELDGFVGYAASKAPETLADKVEVSVADIIKLDANENVYGCSPGVNAALRDYPDINIYPDPDQTELRKQIGEYTGVGAEHVVAGNGSDQLIDLIIRLFISSENEVINCPPTFALFPHFMNLSYGVLVPVPRDENFAVDVAAVKAAINQKTRLILLATPNNPTGTVTPRRDILEILDTGVPVLVDEAYYEFCGETVASLVSRYPNLMVLRTFSKWAGLAGLRVGYGLFPVKIADYLMKIKEPYCVNAAAMVAVRESFRDREHLMGTVRAMINERERMFAGLEKLGWLKPFPSRANFIYCAVLKGKAGELQQKLLRKGILVRYFDLPFLQNSVRISVGKSEHTDILIKRLQELEGEIND
ncbi:MAG: histidinol-phosphate transaminase [Dehalococcoidales bacterium]|jgi:histidinol-phosphate aminotransferase|nr:histidinol-phosphate transaminase [Dehalococcoidales bacterium]